MFVGYSGSVPITSSNGIEPIKPVEFPESWVRTIEMQEKLLQEIYDSFILPHYLLNPPPAPTAPGKPPVLAHVPGRITDDG